MSGARLFALPPGVDFARAFVDGLLGRMQGAPPESLARVRLLVNSARMRRRIREEFDRCGARLLPRIELVDELGSAPQAGFAAPEPPLRRQLMLAQLVARLLEREPGLAPAAAVHGLAESLGALMDEMQDEGLRRKLYEAAERLFAQLAEHAVCFYDPPNVMVQWTGPERFRLRIVDFEPQGRALVPGLSSFRPYVRSKVRRRCARYLQRLRDTFFAA